MHDMTRSTMASQSPSSEAVGASSLGMVVASRAEHAPREACLVGNLFVVEISVETQQLSAHRGMGH
jgi:hypothetical protein